MFIQDPASNPLLDLEYLRTVVYPTLNTITLIIAVAAILGARFVLNKRRLEALFAMISIVASVFAYAGWWLGIITEDVRNAFVRAAIPVLILAVSINSILDLYYERKSILIRLRAWASTFHPHKPNH